MKLFGFEICRTRKRRPSRRRSPEEIIARQKAKRATWAEDELHKLAKEDQAVMLQVLSADLGREIRPTTLEDRLKAQLSEKLLDIAIEKLEADPAFARKYINAIIAKILGMTPEELAAYATEKAGGKGIGEKKSGLKEVIERVQDYRRLCEELEPSNTGGGGIGKAFVEFMNSNAMVELVKVLPSILTTQTPSPPEKFYAITSNDKPVLITEFEYQQMARDGKAPPLLSISKTDLVNIAPSEHGDSGVPIPTELAGQEGITNQSNPNAGGMVVKAVDDVVRAKRQPSDSTWQLLRGLGQNIDLATHSEPDEFVEALSIGASPECSELLHLLAEMDSEIILEELPSLQEDNKYKVVVDHLFAPEGRLWLKRVIEEAKNIMKDTARNTETKNSGG